MALFVGAELAVTSFVQNRIEERVRASPLDAGGVEAEVDSFPLVTTVLFGGRVDRVSLTLRDVDRNGIHFESLRLVLTGIEVNTGELLRGDPSADSIRRGTISARVTAEGPLAEAAELGEVPADVLPCEATVRSVGSELRLSCTMTPVPQAVLREFGILSR